MFRRLSYDGISASLTCFDGKHHALVGDTTFDRGHHVFTGGHCALVGDAMFLDGVYRVLVGGTMF